MPRAGLSRLRLAQPYLGPGLMLHFVAFTHCLNSRSVTSRVSIRKVLTVTVMMGLSSFTRVPGSSFCTVNSLPRMKGPPGIHFMSVGMFTFLQSTNFELPVLFLVLQCRDIAIARKMIKLFLMVKIKNPNPGVKSWIV